MAHGFFQKFPSRNTLTTGSRRVPSPITHSQPCSLQVRSHSSTTSAPPATADAARGPTETAGILPAPRVPLCPPVMSLILHSVLVKCGRSARLGMQVRRPLLRLIPSCGPGSSGITMHKAPLSWIPSVFVVLMEGVAQGHCLAVPVPTAGPALAVVLV